VLFLPDPSRSTCHVLFAVYCWLATFAYLITNSILVLRTYAIWENKRNVAFSLFILLVICFVAAGYCAEKFVLSLSFIRSPSRSVFPGCFIVHSGGTWFTYLLILVFDTAVLILTIIKAIQRKGLNGSTLFRTIYRDGVLYYVYLSVLSLINIIVFITMQNSLSFSLVNSHRVLHSILTARLVINIRRAGALPSKESWLVSAIPETSEDQNQENHSHQLE